jgi:photosystem II stability/assembly factor-like uncharacterized protein
MKRHWLALMAVFLAWMVAIMVLFCMLGGTGQAVAPDVAPTITEISPASAPNDLDTPLVITGTGFTAVPTVYLGSALLEDTSWLTTTRLTAVVPWGLFTGTYALTVTNPGGESGSLADAFTVTQGIGMWTTGGPYGGQIPEIVVHPVTTTTVYAVAWSAGLFASFDRGEQWQTMMIDDSLTHLTIDAQDPLVMYAGGGGTPRRTRDGGNSWLKLTGPFYAVNGCSMSYPVAHPENGGHLYFGMSGCLPGIPLLPDEGGIYYTDDYGDNWVTRTAGLTDLPVTSLAFHPDDSDIMLAGTESGNVFLSTDEGLHWAWQARLGEHIERIYFNPFGTHEAWATTYGGPGISVDPPFLYKSADVSLGVWEPISVTNAEGYVYLVSSLAFDPDKIWAGAAQGFTSQDGGVTWTPVSTTGMPPDDGVVPVDMRAFAIDPGGLDIVYAGNNTQGVYKSDDGGLTWHASNTGLAAVVPGCLAVSPDDPESLYSFTYDLGVLKSSNAGNSWQTLGVFRGHVPYPKLLAVDPFTTTRVYLGDVCLGLFCLRVSEDAGETWREITSTLPVTLADRLSNLSVVAPHPLVPGRILAGANLFPENQWGGVEGQLFSSDGFGEHWQAVQHAHPISSVLEFAYDTLDPQLVYLGTEGSGLWKSQDGGTHWQAVIIPDTNPPVVIDGLAAHPYKTRTVLARTLSFGDSPNPIGVLQFSDDAGETWTQLNDPEVAAGLLFAPTEPVPILYTACGRDFCRSQDEGQTWQQVEGAPRPQVMALGTDGKRIILYVATAGGVVTTEYSTMQAGEPIPGLGSLLGGGIYRYTSLQLEYWVYLPLVLREYQ